MKRIVPLITLAVLMLLPACDSFVEGVQEPTDSASNEALNDETQVPFLINGILAQWADSHDQITVASDLLSDQVVFGANGDATFPTYQDLDNGVPALSSNTVDGAFNALGQYRFLADDARRRIQEVEFTGDAPMSRDEALYHTYLHSGIARYYYATYFGLEPDQGGGVINRSAFIPSAAMYDSSRVHLEEALALAPTSEDTRIVNSILARNELYAGDYAAAAVFAQNGMVEGDAPFDVLYSVQDLNEWWSNAGRGRVQAVVDARFYEAIQDNPDEAVRIPITGVTEDADFVDIEDADAIEHAQDKYPQQGSSIHFINWQENALMLAELGLRGEDIGGQTPLDLVNQVRASYDLDPRPGADLEVIAEERDRTLFVQGARLPDQRRLSDVIDWHLPDTFQGRETWQYLPITQEERSDNSNL